MSRPKIKQYKPGDKYLYAHLKRDGIWLELCGGFKAGMYAGCWTRHPTDLYSQLSEHPAVREFFRRVASADYVRLYCELFAPGHPQSEVKSLLAQGKMGGLVIECFATPDLLADAQLVKVENYSHELGVPFNTSYACISLGDPSDRSDLDADEAYNRFIKSSDSEGVVYKDGNLLNWAKRKAEPTADLVIIGYTDGRPGKTGKMLGKVGALVLGLHGGQVVCNCSGMDDVVRDEITANKDAYLGRVVEVRYQYVGSGGGLRHPRFVRFRDDKRAEECTEI